MTSIGDVEARRAIPSRRWRVCTHTAANQWRAVGRSCRAPPPPPPPPLIVRSDVAIDTRLADGGGGGEWARLIKWPAPWPTCFWCAFEVAAVGEGVGRAGKWRIMAVAHCGRRCGDATGRRHNGRPRLRLRTADWRGGLVRCHRVAPACRCLFAARRSDLISINYMASSSLFAHRYSADRLLLV